MIINVKCQLTKIEFHDGSFYQFTYDELGRKTAETGAGSLYGENVYGGVPFGEKSYGSFKYGDKTYYGFDPANTIFYEYDAGDRLIKISYPAPPNAPSLPGGAPAFRMDIGYEYFDDNKIRKITDVAGNDRVYSYDSKDRLTSVTMYGKTVTYHYDDENYGRLDYIILPNGIKKEYIYDDENTLTTVKYTKDNGNTVLYRFDSVYSSEGLLMSKTFTNPSGVSTKSSYNYDTLKRLVNKMENGIQKSWTDYDPVGNILKEINPDSIENYDYNANDKMICHNGMSYEYDLNGNMTAQIDPVNGITEFVYYYNNGLAKIKHPDNTEDQFFYNSDGKLNHKIDKTGKTTYYYYDNRAAEAVNETDTAGNVIMTVFPGIGYKSAYNNNEWRYFITGSGIYALMGDSGRITDRYGLETEGNSFNPFESDPVNYHSSTALQNPSPTPTPSLGITLDTGEIGIPIRVFQDLFKLDPEFALTRFNRKKSIRVYWKKGLSVGSPIGFAEDEIYLDWKVSTLNVYHTVNPVASYFGTIYASLANLSDKKRTVLSRISIGSEQVDSSKPESMAAIPLQNVISEPTIVCLTLSYIVVYAQKITGVTAMLVISYPFMLCP